MSRRTFVPLAASVVVGIAAMTGVSTAAFAKKAVRHPVAVVAVAPAPAPLILIDNHYGPVGTGIPRCFDSPISYPVPPCY